MTAIVTHCQGASCDHPFRPGEHVYYGVWCSGCYKRWLAFDRPDTGPPPKMIRGQGGREVSTAKATARAAEAVRLAGLGLAAEDVARRVGVTRSTVRRYFADYRNAGREIAMPGIESDVLHDIGPAREPAPAEPPAVDRWRNGHRFSDEEMDVVAEAHKEAREREAEILSGLVWDQDRVA